MKFQLPWGNSISDDEIDNLENLLGTLIYPVKPRADFVATLYGNLLNGPLIQEPPYKTHQKEIVFPILAALAGCMVGTILIIGAIRSIQTIIKARQQ